MMADIPDPTFLKCFQNHRLSINWVDFSPNGDYLASVSDDCNVMLWALNDQSNTCYMHIGHKDSVSSVAMTNDFMISGSKDNTARLWRIDQRQVVGSNISSQSVVYRCHKSPINCVDINIDQTKFCTASDDQTVKIWSTTCANKMIASLSGEHHNWVRHARFSKLNQNLLSSCADDGTICVWDTRSRNAAIKLSCKRRSTHFLCVQWHPTCEYIMSSSSSDCLIRIWDLRYEKTIQFYQVHNGLVSSSDFHSSGNYLISSSLDQTSKIIDLFEGRTLFTLRAHTGPVNCAKFSSNGEYFATAGQDHTVLLWQSNLPKNLKRDGADGGDDDDDADDIRSISFDPTSFSNDTFGRIGDHQHHHRSTTTTTTRSSSSKSAQNRKQPPMIDSKASTHQHAAPTITSSPLHNGITSVDSNHHVGTSSMIKCNSVGENLRLENSKSVLKCILQQLETMTDSILQIDQRLTALEDQFKRMSVL